MDGSGTPGRLLGSAGIPVPAGGNFQGRPPRGRPRAVAGEAASAIDRQWSVTSRYDRWARVTDVVPLTTTGTIRMTFEVTDERPFSFLPGNFVGVECFVEGLGYRRSPYCILSVPSDDRRFELIVRVVPDGPVSQYLASLHPGDEVAFRGPKGRSMIPSDGARDLVLVATGVGVGPFLGLATLLLGQGFEHRIDLFWGLRLVEDICLLDELDALATAHPNFTYRITLSKPSDGWEGLRGRVTESMPPLVPRLANTKFYLCGNGAMIEQLAAALSDLGLSRRSIYEEPYFDARRRPDPATVAAIRDRFVANDLFSAFAHREATKLHAYVPVGATLPNADPSALSDLFRGPEFLSHRRR
jgi:NAD(P)H-flavin reductase